MSGAHFIRLKCCLMHISCHIRLYNDFYIVLNRSVLVCKELSAPIDNAHSNLDLN